jgi:hypothetical protein
MGFSPFAQGFQLSPKLVVQLERLALTLLVLRLIKNTFQLGNREFPLLRPISRHRAFTL